MISDDYKIRKSKRQANASRKAKQRQRDSISHIDAKANRLIQQLQTLPFEMGSAIVAAAGYSSEPTPQLSPAPTIEHYNGYPPFTPLQTAAVQLDVGLSGRQMDKLRRHAPGLYSSRDKTKQAINNIGVKAVEIRELLNGDGDLSMAYVSLKESLIHDIRHWHECSQATTHTVKVGGDSTTDIRDKNKLTKKILMMVYTWVGIPLADRDINHGVLAAAWTGETHGSIGAMARRVNEEMNDIKSNGLLVNGTTYI